MNQSLYFLLHVSRGYRYCYRLCHDWHPLHQPAKDQFIFCGRFELIYGVNQSIKIGTNTQMVPGIIPNHFQTYFNRMQPVVAEISNLPIPEFLCRIMMVTGQPVIPGPSGGLKLHWVEYFHTEYFLTNIAPTKDPLIQGQPDQSS